MFDFIVRHIYGIGFVVVIVLVIVTIVGVKKLIKVADEMYREKEKRGWPWWW